MTLATIASKSLKFGDGQAAAVGMPIESLAAALDAESKSVGEERGDQTAGG